MASFGESLRRQRELRQVTLREVSEATKINIRYLEALERNEFTHLPGGAFTKGYIRAFAKHIGIDETEMLDAYVYELAAQEQDEAANSVSSLMDHFAVEGRDEEIRRRRARILVITVGIAILLAIVVGAIWGLGWWLGWSLPGLAAGASPS